MWQLNSKKEGFSIDRLVRCFDVFLRRRSQVSAHAAPDDAAEPASVAATNAAPFTNTHSVADSLSVVPAIAAAEPLAITAANSAPVGDPDTAADALTYKHAVAASVVSADAAPVTDPDAASDTCPYLRAVAAAIITTNHASEPRAVTSAEPPAITAANCAPVGDPDTAADALTYKRAFAAPVASSNQHAFTTSLALAHGITDNAAIAASHAFSNVRGGFAALVAFVGLLLRLVWGGALIAALAGPHVQAIVRAEGLAPFIRAERARIF